MPIPAIIAPLLAQGLSLLGNAVLAKGKDWVEQQTGVSLDKPLSPEDTLKLRQYEMDHEEELLRLRLEDNKLGLEGFKLEVADRDSARVRDAEFIKKGATNHRANVMFFLAVVMVGILVWIVWKDQSINEYVKGIFTLVLGRFLGYLDNIYNFEFGTTRGSREKDDTINKMVGGERK
jgi:hypothetical protein